MSTPCKAGFAAFPAAVVSLFVVAVVATSDDARAADAKDNAACKQAYESSQENRKEGALIVARGKLRLCASEACPDVVRSDCIGWLAEVERAIPSVVLEAKVEGQLAMDAAVTLDGRSFATKLDGRPIDVDPGLHVFVFHKDGRAPIEQRVVVREQQKSVLVSASWDTPRAATASMPPAVDDAEGSSGWRTVGFVAGGVGVAGLVVGSIFGVSALGADKSASRECATSTSCTQAGADFAQRAHFDATLSTVAFVAGGALVAGGAALVLLAPRFRLNSRGMNVTSTLTASSPMLVVSGAF